MQLKLSRSQREGGFIGKSILFCLDARVAFTAAETANIRRYKLQDQIIYSSEAALSASAGSAAASAHARAGHLGFSSMDDVLSSAASKMGHGLKAAALGALATMKLTISIGSLERGHHIECKSLDELLGAEEAIMDACRSLKGYLDTAATFDGREVLVDFSTDEPTIVASAPAPMLFAPSIEPAHAPTALPSEVGVTLAPPVDALATHAATAPPQEAGLFERIGRGFNAMTPNQREAVFWCGVGGLILVVVLMILF